MGAVLEDEVKRRSTEFIDGLDRNSLGRFAVPRDALYWYDVFERNEYMARNSDSDEYLYTSANNQINFAVKAGTARSDILAEWFFWWEIKGTPSMQDWIQTKTVTGYGFDRIDLLYLASSMPVSYHDYLVVGIKDKETIRKFIENGIDPELALAVEK